MSRPGKKRPPPPEAPGVSLVPVGTTASSPIPCTLQELQQQLTPLEEAFSRLFVLYNNATRAYVEASQYEGPRHIARACAWGMTCKPHIRARIREYESAAAAATVIDFAAILEHDRAIVEGYKHADQITQRIYQCCRYCHGEQHKFQWIDFEEYLHALQRCDDENNKRKDRGQRDLPQPSDAGGYGYEASAEPNLFCPRCEGRGLAVDIIADTTRLEGPARAIVKGIKVTSTGTEVLLHDIDKAKERLLRAGGILKDDTAGAAARGAAAGVIGAAAAIAAAERVKEMTLEEAQRLYLELA